MAIEKIDIERFLQLADQFPVLDVRSLGEFSHAHIPQAHSLPLFSDEERKLVGTAYKQQSREAAIKIGLDFFGVKMKMMVEQVEAIMKNNPKDAHANHQLPNTNRVLVHCWRGGMRSAAVAWLLDMYGFKVYTLSGGYKGFRNWVLNQFEKQYDLKILGGYTGSGKTKMLQQLQEQGTPVIDLEGIANHKGSAFGGIGEHPQPSQELFENVLAVKLRHVENKAVWLEDESQRIGKLLIPNSLWKQMRESPVYFVDIPFEERLHFLLETYGGFEKEKLINAIVRIQKRLGGLETKNTINFLLENNTKECFRVLLKYYDKLYAKGMHNRNNNEDLLNIIPCNSVNAHINANHLVTLEFRCSEKLS